MADTIAERRTHVPSPREVAAGAAGNGKAGDLLDTPLSPGELGLAAKPRRRSPGEVLRDAGRDLDPRTIPSDFGPRPLVLLGLIALASGWDDAVLGTLAPEIRRDFGVSLAFIVTITTFTQLLGTLLAPAIGYAVDRVKRVRFLAIGMIIGNTAGLAAGLSPNPAALAGTRVVASTGGMVSGPTFFPLMSDWYPQEYRARAFAFLGIWGRVGGLLGPLLAGGVGQLFGWRPAAIAFGLVAIFVSIPLLWLSEPPRGYYDRKELGASDEVAEKEPEAVSWGEAWRMAGSIHTVRRMWYATPFLTLAGEGISILLGYYYAEEFGLGSFARGVIAVFPAIVGVIGLALTSRYADRMLQFQPGRVMTLFAVATALNVVPVLVLVLSPYLAISVALGAALGLVQQLVGVALTAVMSLAVPAQVRGLGLQTFAPWKLLGLLFIPSAVAMTGGDLRVTMALLVPIFLIGAAIVATTSTGIGRDIRSATAASLAAEESRRAREEGRTKLLVCRDVEVSYDGTQVLFGVDFDAVDGEIIALLGTNGAGKSTLLRAIAGVHEASGGAVFLDGRDITHRPPGENAANGLVFVPGGRAVFPSLTVAENLDTARYLLRGERDGADSDSEDGAGVGPRARSIDDVLELFPSLRDRLDEQAGNLSGGEQQMVALGQALLMRPRLLMIDELSLGLAPAVVERLLDVVRLVNRDGTTVVLVEQSINVALTIASRAVFLDKGRVRFDGSPEELLGRSDLVRAVFLGGAGGGTSPVARRHRRAPGDVEEVLRVEDVHVSFGGVKALTGAALDVAAGEVVGIIGPNGAGKTTLFDAISGFVRPDAGRVVIAGTDATSLGPDARARLGLARSFQNARLFPSLTVHDAIAVALETRLESRSAVLAAAWAPPVRRTERRVERRVEWLISLYGLEAFADKFLSELSTGSRRIVDLACISATEPKVLLLDEPSSGLAQAESEALAPVVRRFARDTGCGVAVIEHDIPLVTAVSDRMIAMDLGRPLVEGTPAEVVSHPQVVEAYLGADRAAIERSGPLASILADKEFT